MLVKYPKFIEAALLRAAANEELKRYDISLKELDHVIRIRPHLDSYARALGQRAWLRSTCPDASFRNYHQAVQDAKLACKLTNWKDATMVDTLAVATAQGGDLAAAMRYEEQAISSPNISSLELKRCRQHLAVLKQHQPIGHTSR